MTGHCLTTPPHNDETRLVGGFRLTERRGRDLNPRSAVKTDNGFRDRRIRPLCHLSSAAKGYPHRWAGRSTESTQAGAVAAGLSGRPSPADVGRGAALELRLGVARMRLEPGRVAVGERGGREPVREHREADRVITVAVMMTSSCGSPPSSTRITAKTIDARPRGPNQPRKPTVWRRAPVPSIAIPTGIMRTSVRRARRRRRSPRSRRRAPGRASRRRRR